MAYLTDPAAVIEARYESLTKTAVAALRQTYEHCGRLTDLLREFETALSTVREQLRACGVTQETAHTEIFRIVAKSERGTAAETTDEIETAAMDYFLDLMLGASPSVSRHSDFDLEPIKHHGSTQAVRDPSPAFQALVRKLREKRLRITRLCPFVEVLKQKMEEKGERNEGGAQGVGRTLGAMREMSAEDEQRFRSLVNVRVCRELCPGCQRICGVEEAHTGRHEVRFGHQMRALGGTRLSNGDASVLRCEDMQLLSRIEFNGRIVTWKEFQ